MVTVSCECRFDMAPFSISKQCKDGVMTNLHCSHSLMVCQIPLSESEGVGVGVGVGVGHPIIYVSSFTLSLQ